MNSSLSILIFSGLLFCIGLAIILNRRNLIHILIGIELMLNSANVNLVLFSTEHGEEGIMVTLFIMLIAVCEAAVGLAIFLRAYRHFRSPEAPDFANLREP